MNWIGKPLGKGNNEKIYRGKPYDFFKTHKKDYPSQMFKDTDRDGVMDVFDCKPFNPKKQGFIDAVIGAVKGIGSGGVKKGWQEGMAVDRTMKRNFKSYTPQNTNPPAEMETYDDKPVTKPSLAGLRKMTGGAPVTMEEIEAENRRLINERNARIKSKSVMQKYREIKQGYRDLKDRGHARAVKIASANEMPFKSKLDRVLMLAKRSNPKYSMAMEYRAGKMKELQKEIDSGTLSKKMLAKREAQLRNKKLIQAEQGQQISQLAREQVGRTFTKAVVEIFPQVYAGTSRKIGAPGQRGRPRGSLDPRYRQYGGVYGYRKYVGQQRRLQRMAMQQQIQSMRSQRVPKYESQTYQQAYQGQPQQQQQVPQEMQGQMTPEMAMQQAQQQQMPQQQQQPFEYLEQPKPEPAHYFQGTGRKPYPAVNRQPIAPSAQTIPYGYVETVDSFTGERKLKPLPKPERWSQNG